MPKFYISVILLINQSKEIGEKQFSVLAPEGAKLAPKCMYPFVIHQLCNRLDKILPSLLGLCLAPLYYPLLRIICPWKYNVADPYLKCNIKGILRETQLNMKFILLIHVNVKMPATVEILTFIEDKYSIREF